MLIFSFLKSFFSNGTEKKDGTKQWRFPAGTRLFPSSVLAGALFIGLLLGVFPSFLHAKSLEPLSDREMSQVSGQEGLAVTMDGFRSTGGDAHIHLFSEDFFGDPDFDSDRLSLGNFRWNSPGQWESEEEDYPTGISPECEPFHSFCSQDDEAGVVFGARNDPFEINVTEDNPTSDNDAGVIALQWPNNRSNMERVNLAFDVRANDGASGSPSNDFLTRATIGNALWAGNTQLEVAVYPGGGVDLGIDIQLDGDVWFRTQNDFSADGADGGGYLEGVFGASSYTGGSLSDCCDDSQFSGALSWASIEDDRPLWVRFNNDQLVIERVQRDSAESGTIGINELNLGGQSFGTTVADDVIFDYLKVEAPL